MYSPALGPPYLCYSANVLLDLSFRAKVGDFGLARALNEKGQTLFQSQTHRVVGTSGYIAPEYYHGTITTKLDTYAFGVVSEKPIASQSMFCAAHHSQILLEVLTGLPSFDQERKHTDLVCCSIKCSSMSYIASCVVSSVHTHRHDET